MTQPLVSIITPCYNQAIYLDDCLNAVINQNYTNWECLVINDGSTDNSQEIAEKWCQKDHRIKLLNLQNGGVCRARNQAIKQANGTYILPLDADDYVSNNYILECLNTFKLHTDAKVVYGTTQLFGVVNKKLTLQAFNFEKLLEENMIVNTAMYLKSDWETCGGYDEKMTHGFEDWEFYINLLKAGGNALCNKNCIYYYRIKEQSRNADIIKNKNQARATQKYIFNKHQEAYLKKDVYEYYLQTKYIKLSDLLKMTYNKILEILKRKLT